MVKTRSHGLHLLPLALSFVLPSCASGPPPGPSPLQIAGMDARTIVVAPFNIVSSLPPELEGSTRMVSTALVRHLQAHGKTVRVMAFRSGRDLWRDSTKEVRDAGQKRNFENAARVYARKIGEQIEFDALIVPSLFIQNAKMRGRTVRWDGAEDKIEIRGSTGGSLYMGQGGALNVRAASIFIYVLNAQGEAIHTKRSGLEVVQHLEWQTELEAGYSSRENTSQELVDDVPAIQDKEKVAAGIANALSPFLSEERPAPVDASLQDESSPQPQGGPESL